MIRANRLRKTFKSRIAVDDVSFSATGGQITGLLGANGAGKSTTLRMIASVLRPDSGSVEVEPRSIGALMDHAGLYGRLTARENLSYFGELHGLAGQRLRARVTDLIGLLRLERVADVRAGGFSQGERMKVALGRALIHEPGNVLLDEPTNGLDVPSVRALRQILRQLRDGGCCIVFSSHVLQEVSDLCDHLVILSDGRVSAEGSPDDIYRESGCGSLEEAFMKLTARESLTC